MRIDKFLVEKYGSRNKAASAIMQGLVLVNGKTVNASYEVKPSDSITLIEPSENFVSVGGFKLSKAIKDFNFNAKDKVFIDVGASTGGFTDCLLQNGAKRVYCIDVGDSQLDKSLLSKNITVIDNFNARNLNLDLFDEKPDSAVIDVSFISLTYILGATASVIPDGGEVIALIKPQFECESKSVGKNGIVKGKDVHEKVITKICEFAIKCNLYPHNLTNAPIVAGKNKEYLILLKKNENINLSIKNLINCVIL